MGEIDFEAEGLLEGVEGEERDARLELLYQLAESGCEAEELRRAVAEDRLAVLPVELVFRRDLKYTVREATEDVGLDEEFMTRDFLALGLSRPDLDELALSEADVQSMRGIKAALDAGLPEESILELARIVGRAGAQTASAVAELFVRAFLRAGDTERDFGLRFAEIASALEPTLESLISTPTRMHLRELMRREVIGSTERHSGALPGAREVTVAFADLVGFTSLSERSPVEHIGQVATLLEEATAQVAEPPVRLIKLIGDEVMLVSTDTAPLVGAMSALVARVETDERLPQLRVGIAAGPALNRAGDWYGRSVNLASRVTGVGEAGAVVATQEVVAGSPEAGWQAIGERTLKGVSEPVALFRLSSGAVEG